LATLHERLLAALAEINIQENLVKKHVKVAEEAVAGKNIFSPHIFVMATINSTM
jgi:hypothetical protein